MVSPTKNSPEITGDPVPGRPPYPFRLVYPCRQYIKVGMSTCGIAAGASDVFDLLAAEVKSRAIPVDIRRCGCVGMCHAEPLVEVAVEGLPTVVYGRVTPELAQRILEEHVAGKRLINDHIYMLPLRR